MRDNRDIFDKLMCLPILNVFEPFYKKNKDVLLYLFFGGLTFIISIVTYAFFDITLSMNELVANDECAAGTNRYAGPWIEGEAPR